MPLGPRARVLLIAAAVFAVLAALVWYLSTAYWSQPVTPLAPPRQAEEAATPQATATPPSQTAATPSPQTNATPPAQTTATPTPSPPPSPPPRAQGASGDAGEVLASMRLLIPVAGVKPSELRDTFSDARSEGRVHDAIDVPAPRNTPVVAAADGRVVKLFHSAKGGTTVYQLASADEHFVFYYAHLDHYADRLAEGHVARRGEAIGYVGDTGDAAPGNTHLHFQIYRVADPRHFWTGENINPYPLLHTAQ